MEGTTALRHTMGPADGGLRNICHNLRELQAMCAEQSAEIASLRSDCTHYRKRFAEVVQNCASSQQRLAEVSKNEAALEQRRREAEVCVTQLRQALTEMRGRLEEAEVLKRTAQDRHQQLEQRLEHYITREAEKHRDVVQTMEKRMKLALLRLTQYKQQRHRLVGEVRRMHQKIVQLDRDLQQKMQEADTLRCITNARELELQHVRLAHDQEKANLDVRLRDREQEAQAAKLRCDQRDEELQALRRNVESLKKRLTEKEEECERAYACSRQKEHEILQANQLVEQQRDRYETLLRQGKEALEVSRSTALVKDDELQRKQEFIERQKLDYEQQRMRYQQDAECLAYALEAKQNDTVHLRELLTQQKEHFEAILRQRDREDRQKDNDLQRARETIREKQEAIRSTLEDCARKAQAHEELKQAIAEVRQRCDTLAEEHRQQFAELEDDFRRRLETKLKEAETQNEVEVKRRVDDVSAELRKAEAEAIDFERRKAAAELQRVQTMVMSMTTQNKGLVKQCKVLASKLEESTASVEKLKELLELEKCKLLECVKKGKEVPLLRQRVAVLQRSLDDQKQQAHQLAAERDAVRDQNKNLHCEVGRLHERCRDITARAAQNEGSVRVLEGKLLHLEHNHKSKENEMALLKEDLAARVAEASIYKDNLKYIWQCVVEVLPVSAVAQAEVCVSQKMTPETVRQVHNLIREAVQTLCSQSVKNAENMARKQSEGDLNVCKNNYLSEKEARVALEEKLCTKEHELAELESKVTGIKERLSVAEKALFLQESSNAQAQHQLLALEEALKKAADFREGLENELLVCEQKLTAVSTQRDDLLVELSMKEDKLARICHAKQEVDEQLRATEKEKRVLREEHRRSEDECTNLKQRLIQKKSRIEDLGQLVHKLQRDYLGTQKECNVLLEARKTNSDLKLQQAARENEKQMQQLRALQQQELDALEEAFKQKERRIIEQLCNEAADREAALQTRIKEMRNVNDYLLGILRVKLLREGKTQEEAERTLQELQTEMNSMVSKERPFSAGARVSSSLPHQPEYGSTIFSPRLVSEETSPSKLPAEHTRETSSFVAKLGNEDTESIREQHLLSRPMEEDKNLCGGTARCSLVSAAADRTLPCTREMMETTA